jgi:hypothetical protein
MTGEEKNDVLHVVACLLADLRYLRQGRNTRLVAFSARFLLDLREEAQGFANELGVLVNRKMNAETGDSRPWVDVTGEKRRLP